ncbi:hypothetical protein [Alicyclobacillus dauci]|uniref:Uncharacterized protein n=1 Tax=Alicyclobacillus dauci TaxID=1475485 RepID=A0ABY6Z4N4_9BACL|nr:hypothetical protein [Alicyclobacillus dauci]WAH37838.1 hypothetical protein NZD86_04850 [Alicyclobacillus dauci]
MAEISGMGAFHIPAAVLLVNKPIGLGKIRPLRTVALVLEHGCVDAGDA